ncbi:transketolase C-terminal domain-containing protein [Olsenella sp. YH-ols2217]|uniref:Transketolase C-terminal domain-containing protein n=1 Tax=Kribbibacterium absianum TaxID=3044210 RepID=A0ABT6ZM24_9ACTN|nr:MULTISPECIES: transketolase C-terminal domain-containing protein [unclassified Olsenella]MDJ1121919.1 transketolase C-terminal domain-containing protein [Olsenella sp. YH-ols2216]MDJ1129927.1 transketolase C-terminal domain-containing protein [Olsenella sp. YH-ols2217]
MANAVPNRAAICEVLMDAARADRDVVVLCSDSRGSGSMTPFFDAYPEQSVEVGIAEQDLVGIAAGLAACGKKSFAVSPACFITTRSYEQCKVDVAYSHTNVKLIGISGGVSYGALGMSHHSAQDLAAMCAIPGMRVYVPSDRFQTAALVRQLLEDREPAYIRVGRNPVEDVYGPDCGYELDTATVLREGSDVAILALGELVKPAVDAAALLAEQGVDASVVDLCSVKPLDAETVLRVAERCRAVLTVEEASPYGGVGSQVAQLVGERCPRPVRTLALPDAPVVTGTSAQVFAHYGLDTAGIALSATALALA